MSGRRAYIDYVVSLNQEGWDPNESCLDALLGEVLPGKVPLGHYLVKFLLASRGRPSVKLCHMVASLRAI